MRFARLAAGSLVVAAVLALADRAVLTLSCVVLALVLLRLLVGPSRRVLESGSSSR